MRIVASRWPNMIHEVMPLALDVFDLAGGRMALVDGTRDDMRMVGKMDGRGRCITHREAIKTTRGLILASRHHLARLLTHEDSVHLMIATSLRMLDESIANLHIVAKIRSEMLLGNRC